MEPIISEHDQHIIENWRADTPTTVNLRLAQGEGDAAEQLKRFCDHFQQLVPTVQIRNASDDPFSSPAIIIGRHENIAYQAVPTGKELKVFLEALAKDTEPEAITDSPRIPLPAQLHLFITPQCPHCPQAATQLLRLADTNAQLRLVVIDGLLFDQAAAAQDIRSVPTLILDNQLRWTGQINLNEVVNQCVQRDPTQLSAASLRQIIESGDAGRLAAMMIDSHEIYPAFFELLLHERWSVRLGAMVTVEYLADEAPALTAQLLDPLWTRFATLSETVQGDMVQVMGQIAGDTAQACLEKIATGDYAESVQEAANEELDSRS